MFEDTWTKNKIPISIACGQWFLTTLFQIDRLFFQYEVEKFYTLLPLLSPGFLYFMYITR